MLTKTWPYGTTRKAKVLDRQIKHAYGTTYPVLILGDEDGEGHVLMGFMACGEGQPGDNGTIVFTKGGPTGGYWKFQKETVPA